MTVAEAAARLSIDAVSVPSENLIGAPKGSWQAGKLLYLKPCLKPNVRDMHLILFLFYSLLRCSLYVHCQSKGLISDHSKDMICQRDDHLFLKS